TFPNALAASLAANDNASSSAIFPNALSEALTGADSYTLGAAPINDGMTEALTAAGRFGTTMTMASAVSEPVTGSDAIATTIAMVSSVAETVTSSSTTSSAATFADAVASAIVANDNATNFAVQVGSIAEALVGQFDLLLGKSFPPGPVNPRRIGTVARQQSTVPASAGGRIGRVK